MKIIVKDLNDGVTLHVWDVEGHMPTNFVCLAPPEAEHIDDLDIVNLERGLVSVNTDKVQARKAAHENMKAVAREAKKQVRKELKDEIKAATTIAQLKGLLEKILDVG